VVCANAPCPTHVPLRSFFVGYSGHVRRSALVVSTSTRCPSASLEQLHAGLLKLVALDEPVLAALVEQVLAGDELASS
jgi:hypothetical protein